MPSLDAALSSTLLLSLAALLTLVVALVLVWSTLSARRGATGRREIAARLAETAAPFAGREPVASFPPDGLEPYRWALAVREEAMGPDHLDVAAACHILGAMYLERERFAEAEPLLQRALQIRTRKLGPSHSDVASTREDLATLYRAQARRLESESLGEGALETQLRVPAGPTPAQSKAEQPKPPAASTREVVTEPVDRSVGAAPQRPVTPAPATRAVTTPGSDGGEDRPDGEELGRVLREIAGLQGVDAEPATAQQLYGRALAMMEATGATDRPELRTVVRELGRLYYRQAAYAEAEPLLQRALALSERALGADAPEVAEIREDLAWLRFSRQSLP
jgi:tetratricopeptide (TPR) repeat protein